MASSEPTVGGRQKTVAESLRGATRTLHKELNRLIVSRLPLALPPQTVDPSVYASGILHIAPVYITFESLWLEINEGLANQIPATNTAGQTIPQDPEPLAGGGSTSSPLPGSGLPGSARVSETVKTLLRNLYVPGLSRSEALKSDLRQLTGWSTEEVEEQLQHISSTGALQKFTAIIQQSIRDKPHVLVAYTYILYMALFAGGRFIRASLESAGDEFWDLPLNFFHFNTPRDGEDIKEEFKQHLSDAESMLTRLEIDDMVHEAVVIFEEMHAVVHQLDERFTPLDARDGPLFALPSEPHRSRAAITKQRSEQEAARGGHDSYGYSHDDLESKIVIPHTPKKKTGRSSEDSSSSTRSVRFVEQTPPSEKRKRGFSFDGQDDDTLGTWVRSEDSILRTLLLVLAYAAALMGFGLIAAITITSWWKGKPGSTTAAAMVAVEAVAEAVVGRNDMGL
ncbi:unnamed protein product [Parascedosporium putredinis]|uniref:Heme oxygenase-like protein n=1 Tax=Parascedosporium putredinis TaxID=1442378 RepID=A0A9P1GUU9_9PEZI|nr:unnamed protein product [Parascedosporium putredinis]CAI7987500.1 unnamed protein product [Parascedosporium putredinis]